LCCVLVLFFFVCCSPCCQFLRIVHFWLPLRYSLTFIYKAGKTKMKVCHLLWVMSYQLLHSFVCSFIKRLFLSVVYLAYERQHDRNSWFIVKTVIHTDVLLAFLPHVWNSEFTPR
jgi:hypothetical protein